MQRKFGCTISKITAHPDRPFGNLDSLHPENSPTMRSRRKRRRIHTNVSRSPTPEQPKKKKKKVDFFWLMQQKRNS